MFMMPPLVVMANRENATLLAARGLLCPTAAAHTFELPQVEDKALGVVLV